MRNEGEPDRSWIRQDGATAMIFKSGKKENFTNDRYEFDIGIIKA